MKNNDKYMWSSENKVIIGIFVVAVFQITWHWFMSLHNGLAEDLLRFYLQHNPHSRKGVAGYVDFMLPAFVLGVLIGRVGWQWPIRKLFFFGILAMIVIFSLIPIYTFFMNKEQIWWWPKSSNDFGLWLIGNTVALMIEMAICVYGGRLSVTDSHSAKRCEGTDARK